MDGQRHRRTVLHRVLSSPYAKGFAGALVALVVSALAWHLYTDHVAFHQALGFLTQHAAAISKLP